MDGRNQSSKRRKRIMIKKVVVASGGFDPVHLGHILYFKEAKALGDKLVVILNNDNWLQAKKGFVFMSQEQRKVIIESIRYVDEVIITNHKKGAKDMSVCTELRLLRPAIFANGGDRFAKNIPEYKLCKELGIKMAFNVGGGKIESSSNLVNQVRRKQ
jgi:cytidyltransferase-like protein